MRIKTALIAAVLLLPAVSLSGYSFIHFDKSRSGLSFDSVKTVAEDSRGFVWIGTYNGLCRYDGSRITAYGPDELGTSSGFISALCPVGDGNVWIGTEGGLVFYRFVSDSFSSIPGFPSNRIFALASCPDGSALAGVRDRGLYRLSSSGGFSKLPVYDGEGKPVENVYRIAVTSGQRVFIASYCDDLYELEDSVAVPLKPGFFKGDDIEGLALDMQGKLWVASKRHGLCAVNINNSSVTFACPLPKDARSVNVGISGRYVWFCTTAGLFRHDPSSGSNLQIKHVQGDRFSLSENYVNAAFTDSSGGLWVATASSGLDYCGDFFDNFKKIRFLDTGESLCNCGITSFAQLPSGRVFVGTEQMGLLVFDPESLTLRRYRGSASLPVDVRALCADGKDLWVGSNKGLVRISSSGALKSYESLGDGGSRLDNRVVSIFRSQEGDLYVGTNLGVCRYDRETDSFNYLPLSRGVAVEGMAQDSGGTMWFATYSGGLFSHNQRNGEVVHFCRTGGSCIPAMMSSVCVDNSGKVWALSFSSGIYEKSGDDFTRHSRLSLRSLPSDISYIALADNSSRLWISTDGGLVEFQPSAAMVRVFTEFDGLLCNKLNKSALRLSDSRMLFGCEDGFIIFDPERIAATTGTSLVSLTDLKINGSPVRGDLNIDCASTLTLAPGEKNISLNFAVPSSVTRGADCIFCRLEGYEDSWRDVSGSRSVEYYNLPKGRYTLRVSTISGTGQRRSAHKPVQVVVKPGFFESVAGILMIILLAVVVVALAMSWFYNRVMNSQRANHESRESNLQSQLYHEKMGFFANVIHEIKTPLTLIRTPLHKLMLDENLSSDQKEDVELIGRSTDYLDNLVKELLEFITVEEHGFVIELSNVDMVERLGFVYSNYLEVARGRNLRLSYIRPAEKEIMCAVDSRAFSKILNNLMSNALKYAESFIEMELRHDAEKLELFVRNDGPSIPADRRESIFSPFVHYEEKDAGQSFGIGLPLARKMAELHGGSLTLSDRSDVVEFVLSIPVKLVQSQAKIDDEAAEEDFTPVSNMPLLLIVEDNASLLGYLKRKLSVEYKVIAVPSAEKALEKMSRYKVDLLLTDLGLQSMSGVELVAKVKSMPSLAHIPVIVLSAVSTVRTKIRCMENGAAMYIEKPFSLDYLMSCIKSVLENRKSIKNAYAPVPDAGEKLRNALPDRDDEFIRRVDRLIADNIADPGLNNKRIEEALFVSHSSLNRRMKELFGTTPNDYIRKKRLDLAAEILGRGGTLVSDVCYAVGFNSPSYFAKCFKERFGVLPAEYIKEKNVVPDEE